MRAGRHKNRGCPADRDTDRPGSSYYRGHKRGPRAQVRLAPALRNRNRPSSDHHSSRLDRRPNFPRRCRSGPARSPPERNRDRALSLARPAHSAAWPHNRLPSKAQLGTQRLPPKRQEVRPSRAIPPARQPSRRRGPGHRRRLLQSPSRCGELCTRRLCPGHRFPCRREGELLRPDPSRPRDQDRSRPQSDLRPPSLRLRHRRRQPSVPNSRPERSQRESAEPHPASSKRAPGVASAHERPAPRADRSRAAFRKVAAPASSKPEASLTDARPSATSQTP
jgi:hypothetical protein